MLNPVPVSVTLAGRRALNILRRERRGAVLSGHAAGLYCRFEGGQVLLVHDRNSGTIPFGLGCVPPAGGTGWKATGPGTEVRNDPDAGSMRAGRLLFEYGAAVEILPPLPWERRGPDPARLRRGYAGALERLAGHGTHGAATASFFTGTGRIKPGCQPKTPEALGEEAVLDPLRGLLAFCARMDADAAEPEQTPDGLVRALIGLGPGLTPLGDDILCGLLAASHLLVTPFPGPVPRRLTTEIAPAVARNLRGATTAQGAAFLLSAACGERFAMLDGLVVALHENSPTDADKALAAVLDVGHTSGSGLLLGALCAVRAALDL